MRGEFYVMGGEYFPEEHPHVEDSVRFNWVAGVLRCRLVSRFSRGPSMLFLKTYPPPHLFASRKGIFETVEIYNPITRTWREGPPMPQGLHGHFPVVYNDTIYVMGGGRTLGRWVSDTFEVFAPQD